MKHLFLIRHAKSSWADDTLHDRERPLNARGQRQLPPLGRALARAGAFSGHVCASPAARAQQTLAGIRPASLPETAAQTDPALYTFDRRRLAHWLKRCDGAETLAIVGHNPALLELAQWLLKHPPQQLPTASFLHLRLPIAHWHQLAKGKARLESLQTPNDFSYTEFARKRRKRADTDGSRPDRDIPAALSHQLQWLAQLEPGVRLGLDEEFLHQYRIALRRSRALAEAVQAVTGDRHLLPVVKGLKRAARATSTLRDLHVWLGQLPDLGADNDDVVTALHTYFEGQADEQQAALVQRLDSKRHRRDLADWQALVESRQFRRLTAGLQPADIRTAVAQRIREYNRRTAELLFDSPDGDVHRLRKLLKRIRYLMELDRAGWKPTLKEIKQRQQLFGRFQDLHVQVELMRQFEQGAPDTLPAAIANLRRELERHKADARRQTLALGGLDGPAL